MQSIQALREQRDAKAKELHSLVNKDDWNAETDGKIYDAGLKDIQDIDDRIVRIKQANELQASAVLDQQVLEATQRNMRDKGKSPALQAFDAFLKNGQRGLDAAQSKALFNTMSTTTSSEGGYTVQTEIARQVADAMKAFGGMRDVCDVIVMESGNPMNYPTSDGTSEEGELVSENTAAADLDISFGTIALNVFKYGSKVVTVPIELIQDSSVDIAAFVVNRLGTRLGRITNKHFTTGTGSGQPNGVVTAAASGVVAATGGATTVTYDNLVKLQHSVDPAYRRGGRALFMMNDTTVRDIRLIKDGNSRPIFVPGYEVGTPGGAPDTLLGSPLVTNQHMASMAANAKSILFGDFFYYKIRDAMQMELLRYGMDDSKFGLKGQVGFVAWMRSGGNLVDVGGAIKYYQNSAS